MKFTASQRKAIYAAVAALARRLQQRAGSLDEVCNSPRLAQPPGAAQAKGLECLGGGGAGLQNRTGEREAHASASAGSLKARCWRLQQGPPAWLQQHSSRSRRMRAGGHKRSGLARLGPPRLLTSPTCMAARQRRKAPWSGASPARPNQAAYPSSSSQAPRASSGCDPAMRAIPSAEQSWPKRDASSCCACCASPPPPPPPPPGAAFSSAAAAGAASTRVFTLRLTALRAGGRAGRRAGGGGG